MRFNELVEQLPGLLRELESQPARMIGNAASVPQRGVYVFYQNSEALYAGRSNRLPRRLRQHCLESSGYNIAPFAVRLAKDAIGLPQDTKLAEFKKHSRSRREFHKAKKRIREMEVRAVEIDDQAKQALFEIYVALELKCKYNDFGTH